MLLAAAEAVASQVSVAARGAFRCCRRWTTWPASSATVAVAVAKAAADDGVATIKHDNLVQAVEDAMWSSRSTPTSPPPAR